MSKGTKKLDAAINQAILDSRAVTKDSRNDWNCNEHASAEAVFDEVRCPLAKNGVTLKTLRFEEGGSEFRPTLVRVVKVTHAHSGQHEVMRTLPWPVSYGSNGMPDVHIVAGVGTLSLRNFARDLLMLPQQQPEPAAVTELHDRSERPQTVWGDKFRAGQEERKAKETEEQIRHEIDILCLGLPDDVVEEAREKCGLADAREDWVAIRNDLLDHEPTNNVQAAGNGSAPSPGLEPPAVLGDLAPLPQGVRVEPGYAADGSVAEVSFVRDACPVPGCGHIAAPGRGLCLVHAHLGKTLDNAEEPTEEEQLASFEFAAGEASDESTEEISQCPEQERREGAPLGSEKQQAFVDPLPSGSEPVPSPKETLQQAEVVERDGPFLDSLDDETDPELSF